MMHLKRCSFNYLFDNYLLRIYNVIDTVLKTGDRMISKNSYDFCSFGAHCLEGEENY